jgi:hypothetical protein
VDKNLPLATQNLVFVILVENVIEKILVELRQWRKSEQSMRDPLTITYPEEGKMIARSTSHRRMYNTAVDLCSTRA